jgi:hypothetical protein
MGTSKGLPTPKGGRWTRLKNDITNFIGGDNRVTPIQIVRDTMRAAGGIDIPSSRRPSGDGPRERGGSDRSGGGGGAGTGGSEGRGRSAVGGAVSGLGSFGEAVRTEGLDRALEILGIAELRNRPAAEVVAQIAEHIAAGADGPQKELLNDALRNALFEAAATQGDGSYDNLKDSLESFLQREGVQGLVELFLSEYVFDRVWTLIENHVDLKTQSNSASDAMAGAVENACRSNVADLIAESKDAGSFESTDWFGAGGQKLGEELVADLEARLAPGGRL